MPPKKTKRQENAEDDAAEVEKAKGGAKKTKVNKDEEKIDTKKDETKTNSRSSRSASAKEKKENKDEIKPEPEKSKSKSKKEEKEEKKDDKKETKKGSKKSPSPSPSKIAEEKKTPEKKEKAERGSSTKKGSVDKSETKSKGSVDKDTKIEEEPKPAKGRGRSKSAKTDDKEDDEPEAKADKKKPMKKVELARLKSMDSFDNSIPRIFITGEGKFEKSEILISAWNVNGLRSVIGDKPSLIDYIKKTDPDIICIGETKIDEDKVAENSKWIPSDYSSYFNCCRTTKGYAGTAILTKVKPCTVKFDLGKKDHDLEGRTITLEFEHFYLVHSYVPNAGEGLNRIDYRTKEWDVDFRNYLNNLRKKKHVILCGDLNVCHQEIDIFDAKGKNKIAGFTPQERAGFTELLNTGFVDTFRNLHPTERKYSWWSARFKQNRIENKGWRLDYFVIDKEGLGGVKKSEINNDVHGSDHCPIELTLDPNFTK